MNETLAVLSQKFGLETVLSAVIVCVVMMIVKKIKPKISSKTELVIRLAISLLVHILFTLITNGEFAQIPEGAMSVCGVSMILCAIVKKKESEESVKEDISSFLPDFDKDKLEEILKEEPSAEIPTQVIIQSQEERQSIVD